MSKYQSWFLQCFQQALHAVSPSTCLTQSCLPDTLPRHVSIVAIGKGASLWAQQMHQQCVTHESWSTDHHIEGVVVTPHGQGVEHPCFQVWEANHPIPDEHGLRASQYLLKWAQKRHADELVLAIISGGGSALLPAPIEPLTLQDEMDLHQALLACGAPIYEINAIRMQVSKIKGGKLAQALSCQSLINYIVSDIPGDQVQWVSSGPTIPHSIAFEEVWRIIEHYQLLSDRFNLSHRVRTWFTALHTEWRSTTADLLHSDTTLTYPSIQTHIIASAPQALKAVQQWIQQQNIPCFIIHENLEGEAQQVGYDLAQYALKKQESMENHSCCVLLSGGEVTVSLTQAPQGRGGPNSESALSFAKAIQGSQGIHALFADTDGIDGYGGHAGAWVDGQSWTRIHDQGVDGQNALSHHASYEAFEAIQALLMTGPTGSNVNDLRVIRIEKLNHS